VVKDSDQWLALLNAVYKLRIQYKAQNSLRVRILPSEEDGPRVISVHRGPEEYDFVHLTSGTEAICKTYDATPSPPIGTR